VVNLHCPACRARKDAPADVWMRLIEPPRKPRPAPPGLPAVELPPASEPAAPAE